MPVPVFESLSEKEADVIPKIKEKTSAAAVFFAVFLVAVTIFTAELFLRDINHHFNNEYNNCHSVSETNSLFQKVAKTTNCNLQRYEGIRLLIHVDVLMPFVVTGYIFILIIRKKKLNSYYRVLKNAFIFLIIWLFVRMIGEMEYYMIKHEPIMGKYVVLLTIIFLLIYLVVLIQRRFARSPV